MNKDLFLAILAMDSYNRVYGTHINQMSIRGQIGNATISTDSVTLLGEFSKDTGFFAIFYTSGGGSSGIAAGETIVAFRGTNPDTVGNFLDDSINGYGLGGGSPYSTQSKMAVDFYKAAVGATDGHYGFGTGAHVTGHSLGGGLAGLVGSLYGLDSTLFDNMAFERGVVQTYLQALQSTILNLPFAEDTLLRKRVYGEFEIIEPNASFIRAFATEGELLTPNRIAQSKAVDPVVSHSERSFLDKHSMAMLVSLLWARENAGNYGATCNNPFIRRVLRSHARMLLTL